MKPTCRQRDDVVTGLRRRSLALATALALLPALAAAGEPAAPAYPVSVRLRLSPEALAARLEHRGPGTGGPPVAAVAVPIGEQARYAYVLALHRAFAPAGPGGADLELEVASAAADLDRDADGWRVAASHALVVRTADGEVLARWPVRGEARLETNGSGALALALTRAAVAAAARFEFEFEEQPGVAAWLAARGVAPLGTRRTPPHELPRAAALRPQPAAPRAATNAYLSLGAGGVSGAVETSTGLAARAGVAAKHLLLQLTWQGWQERSPSSGYYTHEVRLSALGVEVGLAGRPTRWLALRAGGGVHAILGRSGYRDPSGYQLPASASTMVAGGFLGAEYLMPVGASGARISLGLEVRWLGEASLQFGPTEVTSVGGDAVFLLAGGELPWRWGPGSRSPPVQLAP